MANINFIKLGLTKAATVTQYREYQKAGNIVFARVNENGTWSADSSEYVEPLLYIWANGVEYKIADVNALNYVMGQVNLLYSSESTIGSVAYMIKEAIDSYKPKALDIADLIDPSSNVHVEVVEGTDSSMLKLTVDARKASINVGTELPTEPGQHGDYFIVEETITEKAGAEPRRTAYIWNENLGDSGAWQALDGNVDATNVFFKDGIDRTCAIGVLTKNNDDIVNEGKDMNLKELLEYYLVKEVYETGVVTNATYSAPEFKLVAGSSAKPSNLYSYVKVNGTTMTTATKLVEVGSTITVSDINLTETYTYDNTSTINGTAPKITYTKYDKYSTDGTTASIVASDTYTGTTPSVKYTYTDTLEAATATITLNKTVGCTSIGDASANAANLKNGTTLKLDGQSNGVVVEGANTMTLAYDVSGASATRMVDTKVDATAITAYGTSNKGNVSTGSSTANGTNISTSDTNANTSATTYNSTSVTITGVYPIYTNCKVLTANTAKNNDSGSFSTGTAIIVNDNGTETSVNVDKFEIYNYTGASVAKTYYIGAGTVNYNIGIAKVIYVPKTLSDKLTSMSALAWDPDAKSWSLGAGNIVSTAKKTVTINGAQYVTWVFDGEYTPETMELKLS